MTTNWFECKVKYQKVHETGIIKPVIETYLVDAITFSSAEARIVEEMSEFLSGEFIVKAVKRETISDLVIDPKSDTWYRCRIAIITLDEKSGVEKTSTIVLLVQASDVNKALDNINQYMHGTLCEWKVISIAESPVIDVYGHKS